MKNQFLKTLLSVSLVLTLAIVAGISSIGTVFAEDAKGTITIENAGNGATYEAYKIFDATYQESGDKKLVYYTIPDGFEEKYKRNDNFKKLFETYKNGGKTYVVKKDTAEDLDVVEWAKEIVKSASIEPSVKKENTDNKTNVELKVPYGYYYVSTTLSKGATVMVTSVHPTAKIEEKNNKPGWGEGTDSGKTITNRDSKTYSVGETVEYKLTYKNAIHFVDGEKITEYVVKDEFPKGVKFKEITSVKVNDEVLEVNDNSEKGEYKLDKKDNAFILTIPWAKTEGLINKDFYYDKAISTIEVTYTGTVTKEAAKGFKDEEANKNIATINPNKRNDDPGKSVYIYTGQITIDKYDAKDETTKLTGAMFILKNDKNKFLKIDDSTGAVSWEDIQDQATSFETNDKGSAVIPGLAEGTYELIETKAPDGYNLLNQPISIELKKEGNKLLVTEKVANNKGSELPSTGGIGTTILYILGVVFVIIPTIILLARRRARM